jgi:hypothetical protein
MHMLPFLSMYADARDKPEHDENVVLNTFLQSETGPRGPVVCPCLNAGRWPQE